MKISLQNSSARRGFTLTEMMIAGLLTTMVISGVIYAHMAGIRMFQYTQSKLGGNDDARNTTARLIGEIRAAKVVRVGDGDAAKFTECAANKPQQGNAIEIYPTRATNVYVRYFRESDDTLRRMTNDATDALIVARYVTNRIVFSSEDFNGVPLTNNENNRVIALNLQFYQLQYGGVKIGTNRFYDYYQVGTRVTRRALE
jgi:hypothetical protein